MRIAHEAPLCIIKSIQQVTDYDYALVHLFDESEEYFKFFKDAVANDRHVILDNSIFELGVAFNMHKFAGYVNLLRPAAYIVPDALEDKNKTIENFDAWIKDYSHLPGKKIGVVQGKNYDEIVECYRYMDEHADIIAISFDYSYYEKTFPNEKTKYHSWMRGRQYLLGIMLANGEINTDKPHKFWDWIDTVDTSNPVVHGIKGIRYQRQPEYDIYGLQDKESTKLFKLLDDNVDNIDDILYNIEMFKYNVSVR